MKNFLLFTFTLLILLSGCGKKKSKNIVSFKDYKNEVEQAEVISNFTSKYNDFKLRFVDSDFIITMDYEFVAKDNMKSSFGNANVVSTTKENSQIKFDKDNQIFYNKTFESEDEKINGIQQYLRDDNDEDKYFVLNEETYEVDLVEKTYSIYHAGLSELASIQANKFYQIFAQLLNKPKSDESSATYNGEIKYYFDDYVFTSVLELNRPASENDKRDIYEKGIAQVIIEDNTIILNFNYIYTYDESGADWAHKREENEIVSIKIDLKNQNLEKEDLSNYKFED